MNFITILAIDPSGSFEEGKGTTGLCLYNATEDKVILTDMLKAEKFVSKEEYWQAHINYIAHTVNYWKGVVVVIEDFMLDPGRAMQQSYSKMETSKLIGVIQTYCYMNQIPYFMQRAGEVKNRWADNILIHKNIIERIKKNYYLPGMKAAINDHCRDAIRHAVHFASFKNKKKEVTI